MDESTTRTDEVALQVAAQLREQVRTLNSLTQGPPGLGRIDTLYAVLGELKQATFSLGQTAEQLDGFLDRELASGRLEHAEEADPIPTVVTAHDALVSAAEMTSGLSSTFLKAQNALSAVYSRDADESSRLVRESDETLTELPEDNVDQSTSLRGDFPAPIADALGEPEQPGPPSSKARTNPAPEHRRSPPF